MPKSICSTADISDDSDRADITETPFPRMHQKMNGTLVLLQEKAQRFHITARDEFSVRRGKGPQRKGI